MNSLKKLFARALIVLFLSMTVIPGGSVNTEFAISVEAKSTYSKTTIKNVQKKLNKLGYDCGTADGVSGKKTKAAIKEYQEDNDLKVTGTINKTLLTNLGVKGTLVSNTSAVSSSTSSSSSKSSSSTDNSVTKERTVYVTRTGAKYHASGCRYLRQSKIAISLSDARINYTACSVCNP